MFKVFVYLTLVGAAMATMPPEPECSEEGNYCGENEHYVTNSSEYIKTCGNRIPYNTEPCKPYTGCICDEGYVRPYDNGTGTCIPECDCPKIPKKCGLNEVPASCKIKCPPQSCESPYTRYLCIPSECEPGCNCKNNYLRDAKNKCIPSSQCPSSGNPKPTPVCKDKPKTSSVETKTSTQSSSSSSSSNSESSNKTSSVTTGNGVVTSKSTSNSKAASKSDNKATSSQNSSTRVTSDDGSSTQSTSSSSSTSSSHNEESSSSSSSSSTTVVAEDKPCSSKCQPTCAVPNPPGCENNPYDPNNPNACESGYILSKKGGKCIRVEECPTDLGCNGDQNAIVKQCPLPCPSTCSSPNAFPCRMKCQPLGCQCKEGYLLSDSGKCVTADQCPGGNPCGTNEIFVPCKVPCPTNYCPTEDKIRDEICETQNPCFSGCVCKHNYRWQSQDNQTCIPAEECPPIPCTRENEEWKPCRPFCPRINCADITSFCSEPYVRYCDPRCTCRDGYCRNSDDRCVSSNGCDTSK